MEDDFNNFAVSIESDVLSQDFDSIDLYGDKIEEQDTDNFGDNIQYE